MNIVLFFRHCFRKLCGGLRFLTAFIICAAFFSVPYPVFAVSLNKHPNVVISSFSFPPLLHATVDGGFSGTMGETVKMLCEKANLDCKFTVSPLKRTYKEVRSGTSDALITIDVGQLKDCCVPSEWTSPWTAGFFSSKGKNSIPQTQEGLIGKSLIVVSGMKSPYFFAKDLNALAKKRLLKLYKAPRILSSIKMFLAQRAPLLWGGEDFIWYINKLKADARYDFKPLIELPVVIWVRKDKQAILKMFNQAFVELKKTGVLGEKNLLQPYLMKQRYVDAPFGE